MFGPWLGHLGKKPLTSIGIPLARDNLVGLVRNLHISATNRFDRKISGKGAVRAVKWFTLFISNKDMNDIIKIIKSLENSSVLIAGVTKTVKHETKKSVRWISWSFVTTFSRFISTTSNFSKRSKKSRKMICE